MTVESTSFNPNPIWNIQLEDVSILNDKQCTNLFDQNGYHLTSIEQCYADVNGYPKKVRRHETVIRQPWLVWDKFEGAHINHSDLFERKSYSGDALEQLQ